MHLANEEHSLDDGLSHLRLYIYYRTIFVHIISFQVRYFDCQYLAVLPWFNSNFISFHLIQKNSGKTLTDFNDTYVTQVTFIWKMYTNIHNSWLYCFTKSLELGTRVSLSIQKCFIPRCFTKRLQSRSLKWYMSTSFLLRYNHKI